MNHGNPNTQPAMDLAAILNILWRRRLILLGLPALGLVCGLLYGVFGTRRWEAYATIRPGITAYDPSGGPVRQWQLKDITRWYEQELYRRGLVARLGLPRAARPVIRAEFIAQGLTNLQGGEVITLWTTATSPELAAAILDTSLTLFNRFAEADSVSSQIKLTRDGLQLQVLELKNQVLAVDRQEASLTLQLEAARAESLMVAERTRELALELNILDRKVGFYQQRIAAMKGEEPRLQDDLSRLDKALAQVAGGSVADSTVLDEMAGQRGALSEGEVINGLAEARLRVQMVISRNQAMADSLGYLADLAGLERSRLEFKRAAEIKSQMREVERKIGDLILEGELNFPAQRRDLDLQVAARLSKLNLLSPLQRVGHTVVSEKPVRPRTGRAVGILVFLGTLGGVVLAFSWDYLSRNRRQIFRS